MIKEDRIQLNERFCVAFEMLEKKGIIIKNDRGGKGIGDFAQRILGNNYGHIIRGFLNPESDRVISYSQARVFCREYGVNESWMLDGVGSPFGVKIDQQRIEDEGHRGNNILFTSVEAFAGTAVDSGSFAREEQELFSIPGLKGSGMVAFPVSGNSMEPVILDGDVVVCKPLNDWNSLNDNDIYAVKTNGSVWIKYVQKVTDSRNHIAQLKLISANHLEYDPFVEDVNEHTRLYRVIKKISDM